MYGRELKYLATVADLARLDFEAAALTLRSQAGNLSTLYVGVYCGGWRQVMAPGFEDFEISLSAKHVKELTRLIPDDEIVTMTMGNVVRNGRSSNYDELIVGSNTSQLRFPRWGEASPVADVVPVSLAALNPPIAFKVDAKTLVEEIEVAAAYVAEGTVRPILTGVRLDVTRDALTITAFDGFGLLYKADLAAITKGEGSLILPVADFLLGLKLVSSEGDITVIKPDGADAALAYNQNPTTAYFRCVELLGAWPDLSRIEAMPLSADVVPLRSDQVKALAASGKALDSREVRLTGAGARAAFAVEGETGAFASRVKGGFTATVNYDLESLGKLAQIGQEIDFHVSSTPDVPSLAIAGHRRCWIITRV